MLLLAPKSRSSEILLNWWPLKLAGKTFSPLYSVNWYTSKMYAHLKRWIITSLLYASRSSAAIVSCRGWQNVPKTLSLKSDLMHLSRSQASGKCHRIWQGWRSCYLALKMLIIRRTPTDPVEVATNEWITNLVWEVVLPRYVDYILSAIFPRNIPAKHRSSQFAGMIYYLQMSCKTFAELRSSVLQAWDCGCLQI